MTYRPLRGEYMTLRKGERSLTGQVGGRIVCGQVCLGVVSMSSLLFWDKNQSLWLMTVTRRGSMTTELLLEDMSVGR